MKRVTRITLFAENRSVYEKAEQLSQLKGGWFWPVYDMSDPDFEAISNNPDTAPAYRFAGVCERGTPTWAPSFTFIDKHGEIVHCAASILRGYTIAVITEGTELMPQPSRTRDLILYHPGTGTLIPLSDEVYLIDAAIVPERVLDDIEMGTEVAVRDHKGVLIDNYNMTNAFYA
jgi:hypothetical protein